MSRSLLEGSWINRTFGRSPKGPPPMPPLPNYVWTRDDKHPERRFTQADKEASCALRGHAALRASPAGEPWTCRWCGCRFAEAKQTVQYQVDANGREIEGTRHFVASKTTERSEVA